MTRGRQLDSEREPFGPLADSRDLDWRVLVLAQVRVDGELASRLGTEWTETRTGMRAVSSSNGVYWMYRRSPRSDERWWGREPRAVHADRTSASSRRVIATGVTGVTAATDPSPGAEGNGASGVITNRNRVSRPVPCVIVNFVHDQWSAGASPLDGDQVRQAVRAATDRLMDIQQQMRRVENNLKESHLRLIVARERQLVLQDAISQLTSEMDEHDQDGRRPATWLTTGETNQ